jgi:DNA-binding winged helix-turn-helix (wHTH) protein
VAPVKSFPSTSSTPFRVDPRAFRVIKAGRPVALEPKVFEVFLFFVENPGRLIEEKELLNRAWPDTVVAESVIMRSPVHRDRSPGNVSLTNLPR